MTRGGLTAALVEIAVSIFCLVSAVNAPIVPAVAFAILNVAAAIVAGFIIGYEVAEQNR